MMLGIPVPPKVPAPRKRTAAGNSPHTKVERKKAKKNERGRQDTRKMKAARKAITKHFGMQKPNICEILARLVTEGGIYLGRALDPRKADRLFVVVRLVKEHEAEESHA